MGFIFFWVGTSVLSLCLDLANGLRLFKDVADAGYKIDVRRMSEISKQLNPNGTKMTLLAYSIPFYNIMQVYKKTMEYNQIRPMVLSELNAIGVLEEMSEYEKREYAKRPTGLHAIVTPIKMEFKILDASKITIHEGEVTGEIYYKIGKSLNDIEVLKTTGDFSKLPIDKQKTYVVSSFVDFNQKGISLYGKDKFYELLKRKEKMDLSAEVDEESIKPEIKETIAQLEEMKNYYINYYNSKAEKEESGKAYVKK